MRWKRVGSLVCLLVIAGCDRPDEVYEKLPGDYDPEGANGFVPEKNHHYEGKKDFVNEAEINNVKEEGQTVEVCSDQKVSDKQKWMVEQPIIPMVGAGGLDMTGGASWAGLTVDQAQTKDLLCQALYYGDGIAAWGDYYELVAFWDQETREIYDIMLRPGYKGTIKAGDFEFEVNEPITKSGVKLDKTDGSELDPRTEDVLRAIDRALLRDYRPKIDADKVDCVDAGSCYLIMSGTQPVLVFMAVGLYVILEPNQHRISSLEVSLKRPFSIGAGKANVDETELTISGTQAAGIPNCKVTYGTTWKHIKENCLADDPMKMAQVTAAYSNEYINVQLGGTVLYLQRPGLAKDEILPPNPELKDGDEVSVVSINAAYEGEFSMPYSEVLRILKENLEEDIRKELGLSEDEPTGIEALRAPDNENLPQKVQAQYPDRLRPGGIYAAFCEELTPPQDPSTDTGDDTDGTDGGDTDSTAPAPAPPSLICERDASGRPTLPLTTGLLKYVSKALGSKLTAKLASKSYYVQHIERALAEYFNGGPIVDDQINFSPNTSRPDLIYATVTLVKKDVNYTINMYYGGNDDRIHFFNFQKGGSRMEKVLFEDAKLPTPSDGDPSGAFTFEHLVTSPRIGLGAAGNVNIIEYKEDIRRALLEFDFFGSKMEVLAPYTPASAVSGYWVPLDGPQDLFTEADWFALNGGTAGAGFYMVENPFDAEKKDIVAITSSSFFGEAYFCGLPVSIGDRASELLAEVAALGYPCEIIARRSENREFITQLSDLTNKRTLRVADDQITQVVAWIR